MNQDQSNLNQNNFNLSNKNDISNNQPINNMLNSSVVPNASVNELTNPQSIVEPLPNNKSQLVSSNPQSINQQYPQQTIDIPGNSVQNQITNQQFTQKVIESNLNNQNNISNKNRFLYLIIATVASLLILSVVVVIFMKFKNDTPSGQYLSLNMPLSSDLLLEENYIEKTIYTFIYDEDKVVKRIIFTDVYYLENIAKSDYDLYLKNNNYDNNWNMPKKILKLNKNVLTYEYNNDIVEKYYNEFIGRSIDNIINEYGKDKVLDYFKPNLTNRELLYLPEDNSNNKENTGNLSKSDLELIAIQAEQKLTETFTVNYNEAFKINNKYYATVDKNSIEYTKEYSNNEYYYVMNATVRNSHTNIVVGKYLIRCKWDEENKKITNYGDNSKIIIITNIYEEAILKATKSIGIFYIEKDQYKKDILWDTSKLDINNFKTILNELDKINYYNYEYSSVENESYFNEMKKNQSDIIKKLLSVKEINIYTVQIITNNELESATSLTKYINSNLYIADDDNFNNLIEYSKELGLFSKETLNISN